MHSSFMLAAAFALASGTSAHMELKQPVPFNYNSDNGPLAPDGSDFPCKMKNGAYTAPATKNTLAVGSPQTMEFKGSAVHGGGSCQISLTTDLKPTKQSNWKVIHSMVGGCPKDTDGNLPPNPDGDGADKFPYTIPQGVNPGDYTLAWTWFNRIGNPEMYMFCAPITVTGGSKKRYIDAASINATEELESDEIFKRQGTALPDTLPDMFKANMGNGCATTQAGSSVVFPDPGKSVAKVGKLEDGSKALTGNCGSASSGGSNSGNTGTSPAASASGSSPSGPAGDSGTPSVSGEGSDSAPGSASSATGAASPAVTSIVAIPPPGAPGAAKATQSVMSAMASVASAAASLATAQAPAPASTGSPSTGSSLAGSTGSGAGSSANSCTSPGKSVCSPDGMQVGTCGMSKTVVFTKVPAGTRCSEGNLVHANQKRSAKFARSYGRHY